MGIFDKPNIPPSLTANNHFFYLRHNYICCNKFTDAGKPSVYPTHPLGSGYIQRPLNTPANTNGKVRHSYYLVPANGNHPPAADSQDEPQRTPTTAGLLDSTQLYTKKDQSARGYQSREEGRSGSNSGSSEYGFSSMTRSSNFGSGGGEEAIFRNEENGAAYEDYRVIFRGSLFDNRGKRATCRWLSPPWWLSVQLPTTPSSRWLSAGTSAGSE